MPDYQFFGQERSEVIQQRIEFISEQLQSEDLDLTNFIEQLNFYYDNPININATTGEDLDELNLLSSPLLNGSDTDHPLSTKLSEVPSKIITEWDGLLGEIYSRKSISEIQLNKNNRLFYLTLSLFIFIIVLYFILTLFS